MTCVCLAFSALYELIEWWTALATGEAAAAFLGTQGDPWDTQWDMFFALVGALTSQLTLSRLHDRQLARLTRDGGPVGYRLVRALARFLVSLFYRRVEVVGLERLPPGGPLILTARARPGCCWAASVTPRKARA